MASEMKSNKFDYAAGNRYQMSQNEIIRYNIEKLGGITSTLDRKPHFNGSFIFRDAGHSFQK